MLLTFVAGILTFLPVNAIQDIRIPYSLGVATNLVLTTITAGRILWIRRAASHVDLDNAFRRRYNRAIVIILESGAVYCIVGIFLFIAVSLRNEEIYDIGYGVGQQLLNIVPTLTLVHVGRSNTGDTSAAESSGKVPSTQHSPPRSFARNMQPTNPSSWPVVLHITNEETAEKSGEWV